MFASSARNWSQGDIISNFDIRLVQPNRRLYSDGWPAYHRAFTGYAHSQADWRYDWLLTFRLPNRLPYDYVGATLSDWNCPSHQILLRRNLGLNYLGGSLAPPSDPVAVQGSQPLFCQRVGETHSQSGISDNAFSICPLSRGILSSRIYYLR